MNNHRMTITIIRVIIALFTYVFILPQPIGAQTMGVNLIVERVVSQLAWSNDGTKIAVASYSVDDERSILDNKIEVFNGATGGLLTTLQSGGALIASLAWHPNNTDLYTGDFDGVVRKWDVPNVHLNGTFKISNTAIITLGWNPTGTRLASGGFDNIIRILDTSGSIVNSQDLGSSILPGLAASIIWVAYSPDGQNLATSHKNGSMIIRDSNTLQEISRLPFQYVDGTSGDWSPDGTKLATAGNDRMAQIWNMALSTPQLLFTLQGHTESVSMASWNPTGDRLATSSLDGTVRIWDATNGQLIQTIEAQNLIEIYRVDWSSTNKLAYGGNVILDPSSGTPTPLPPIVEFPPSQGPTATPPPPTSTPPPGGGIGGTGLLGQYFDNSDLTSRKLNRVDSTVNFNWSHGSPDASIGVDTFSARWTGLVVPQYSETYTFYTQSDDGVRLWVNNQQIINNWTNHASTEDSGTIALTAGIRYDIRMEYYENTVSTVAKLSWSSSSQSKQIIPQDRLFPNGRIAFQTDRDGNDEVYVMDPSGAQLADRSSNSAVDSYPSAAVGTQKIAFTSVRTGDSEIFSMGLTGSSPANLTNNTSFDAYPAQAQDGRIVFSSTRNGGNFNLWLMNADGSGLTQLTTTSPGKERHASWSRDGLWIVYDVEDGSGVTDLWKIPSAGGTAVRLTQNTGSNYEPSWSPDGTTIAFRTTRGGSNDIYLMDMNGGNQRALRPSGVLAGFAPSWSPDGTQIVFHSWKDGTANPEVYIITVGGTTTTRLTNNTFSDRYVSWAAQ